MSLQNMKNKAISKVRYIVEQYFGLSHLYNKAYQARFSELLKNALDALFRQMAFNLFRASRILKNRRNTGRRASNARKNRYSRLFEF
jgi:hypothetical protein